MRTAHLRHQYCFSFDGILAVDATMKSPVQTSGQAERDPAHPLSSWIIASAALGFLAVALVYAFCVTFSKFPFYDDEGFLMMCVQGYLEGHALFDSVGTSYGPVYYFYQWLVHGLALVPLTHDATGIFCVIHWLLAAVILAVAGWRLTRSFIVAFLVFAQCVVHLRAMGGEPGHPQEVVVLLLALAALAATHAAASKWALPLLGGIGACLALSKINVGGFFGIALLLAVLCYTAFFRSRLGFLVVLASLTGLVPLFLMRQNLGEAWARHYCWQACAGIVAVSLVARAYARNRRLGLAEWVKTGMAFAGVLGILLGIVLLTGSSFAGTMRSLIGGPLNLAGAFCVPLRVEHCAWSAAGALVCGVVAALLRGRMAQWRVLIAVAKGAYGVIGGLMLVGDPWGQLGYLLPWVWLLLVRADSGTATSNIDGFPRSILCLVAVWQGLQAYPVGCTQAAVGTFLAVLIYSVCAHDAVHTLVPMIGAWLEESNRYPRRAIWMSHVGFLAVLFAVFVFKWTTPLAHWKYYTAAPPLDLPGAHLIRCNPGQAIAYKMLARYVQGECDTFVTLPGLSSLYFWTGKRPPTYMNVCGEGIMPDDRQQEQIVAALRKAKRPLVVESEVKWPSNTRVGNTKIGPLPLFIRNEYQEIERLANFRILAPKHAVGHHNTKPEL